ncbi:MAG: alpha/beta fold hydrolase [Thermoprotei archaeon]
MFASINGTKIFFDVYGLQFEPVGKRMVERPVTFVLHGGPGMDHTYLLPWLKPLEKVGQMVFIDHRSTGLSEEQTCAESWTIEQFADDVEALRKYLGLNKINLLGSSFGGMWSLVYAVRYPYNVGKIVLVDTAASWDTWSDAQKIADEKANEAQKKIMRDVFEGRVRTKEEQKKWWEVMLPLYFYRYDEKLGSELIARSKGSPILAAQMFKEIIPKYDVRDKLWRITSPTLIIVGRHDWITPLSQAEEIHRLIPNSKLVIFERSGHMPFIEENERFEQIVGEFLGRQ